jgi:hypothetical protein
VRQLFGLLGEIVRRSRHFLDGGKVRAGDVGDVLDGLDDQLAAALLFGRGE